MSLFSSTSTEETHQTSTSRRESEARSRIGARTQQQNSLMDMLNLSLMA